MTLDVHEAASNFTVLVIDDALLLPADIVTFKLVLEIVFPEVTAVSPYFTVSVGFTVLPLAIELTVNFNVTVVVEPSFNVIVPISQAVKVCVALAALIVPEYEAFVANA